MAQERLRACRCMRAVTSAFGEKSPVPRAGMNDRTEFIERSREVGLAGAQRVELRRSGGLAVLQAGGERRLGAPIQDVRDLRRAGRFSGAGGGNSSRSARFSSINPSACLIGCGIGTAPETQRRTVDPSTSRASANPGAPGRASFFVSSPRYSTRAPSRGKHRRCLSHRDC